MKRNRKKSQILNFLYFSKLKKILQHLKWVFFNCRRLLWNLSFACLHSINQNFIYTRASKKSFFVKFARSYRHLYDSYPYKKRPKWSLYRYGGKIPTFCWCPNLLKRTLPWFELDSKKGLGLSQLQQSQACCGLSLASRIHYRWASCVHRADENWAIKVGGAGGRTQMM